MLQPIHYLFADVPKELVDALNRINFLQLTDDEIVSHLQRLRDAVETHLVATGQLEHRTDTQHTPALQGNFKLRASIPQAAADVLNSYVYPKINFVERRMLFTKIMNLLQQQNIPLHTK